MENRGFKFDGMASCEKMIFPVNYIAEWRSLVNKFNPKHIEKVIFNPPATIIIFKDGTKEIVKCSEGDTYSPEIGFAQAMMNVMFGSRSAYSKFIEKHDMQRNTDNKIKSGTFTLADIKEFKNGKIAVNCKTKDLAISLLGKLDELGIRWEDDCCDLDETEWGNYGENTCYAYDSKYKCLEYSDEDFYKGNEYEIKEFRGWE